MKTIKFWLTSLCLFFGTGILCDKKLKPRQTGTSCIRDSYKCSNGMCIDEFLICDGFADCSDGSDETQKLCSQRFKTCPNNAFRCQYGACVDKTVKCNGENDCVDGSDENLPECNGNSQQTNTTHCQDSYKCSNGMCIDEFLICDGFADCSDGSDETQKLCSQRFKTCPNNAFRCQYGACVDKTAKCNGVNDCVDDSDENLPECNGNSQQTNTTHCQIYEYTCKSGQCIDETFICNGNRDCNDGSDETVALCKSNQCRENTLKCNYGACVSKSSRCDGKKQCADGSDELNCSTTTFRPIVTKATATKPTALKPIYTTSSTTPTMQLTQKIKSCVIPNSEGSIYTYYDDTGLLSPGTKVDQDITIKEDCAVGYYKIDREIGMICLKSGQWFPRAPAKLCLKMCPPMTSDSLDIKCTLNGKNVDCSKQSIPGTKLRPKCKVTHSLPNGAVETPIELFCHDDGTWSGGLYNCIPNCGRAFVKSQPLIANGVVAEYGTAPWNIGVYKMKSLICGGTLISLNLVVSAAHCFWEEELEDKRSIQNTGSEYQISVGKYSRDYLLKDNPYTKIINVDTIYLEEYFMGYNGNYDNDIAVILLSNKIEINVAVSPVCIDWNGRYGDSILNGKPGKVVGWGATEKSKASDILLEASLPYINQTMCRNMYKKKDFQKYVTRDKFCAGSKLGQGVLAGDSGAGYTIVHDQLHYLTGIVSLRDPSVNDSYALFTEISFHRKWIENLYNHLSGYV